jgi:hypothetical protein
MTDADDASQTPEMRADCGHFAPPYLVWERQGRTMCLRCFGVWLRSPQGRAYEAWYVRD